MEGQLSKCVWQKDLLSGRIRQQLYGEISGGHKVRTNFLRFGKESCDVVWVWFKFSRRPPPRPGGPCAAQEGFFFSASGYTVAVEGNLESSLKVQCFYLEALPFIPSYRRCTNWGLVLEIWDRLNLRLLMAECCTRLKRTDFCQVSTSRSTRPTWLDWSQCQVLDFMKPCCMC